MNSLISVFLAIAIAVPLCAQNVTESFKNNRAVWEKKINKGDCSSVRKEIDGFIKREMAAVNPYDYNAMHTIVGAVNLAAKACVMDGAWEDVITYLKQASQIAKENFNNAEVSLNKLLANHNKKLKDWNLEVTKKEKNLQELESNEVLSAEQQESKEQIQSFLDEHNRAITQSEQSIKEIKNLLAFLQTEKESYETALLDWQKFLTKEQLEITKTGTTKSYAVEKIKQIDLTTNKTSFEYLAYKKRLSHLNPTKLKALTLQPLEEDDEEDDLEPLLLRHTARPKVKKQLKTPQATIDRAIKPNKYHNQNSSAIKGKGKSQKKARK